MPQHILIIENEVSTAAETMERLRKEGIEVETAANTLEALEKITSVVPSLIVLPQHLPSTDGLDFIKLIRRDPRTAEIPIIFSRTGTAPGEPLMPACCPDKSPSSGEFTTRVRALIPHNFFPEQTPLRYRYGNLEIDVTRRLIKVRNKRVDLTKTEFNLFAFLLKQPGKVCSRHELLREIWEGDPGDNERIVDTHVRHIRAKLGPADAKFLHTVRGAGYRFFGA